MSWEVFDMAIKKQLKYSHKAKSQKNRPLYEVTWHR